MSRTPPASVLPEEIVLQILHSLAPDITSLKSCAVVNRIWLTVARQLLFRDFTFWIDGRFTNKYPDRVAPGVLCYIKHLSLVDPRPGPVEGGSFGKETFVFREVVDMGLSHNLTTLSFTNTPTRTPTEFLRLVSSCPQLQAFNLDRVWFSGGKDALGVPVDYSKWRMPPYLSRVRFRHSDYVFFTRWLLARSAADRPRITHYAAYPVCAHDIWAIKSLFIDQGAHLEFFAIRHAAWDATLDLYNPLECNKTMSPLTNIRTTYLGGFIKCDEDNTPVELAVVYFSSLRSCALETVVLELKLHKAGQVDQVAVPWGTLDELFSAGVYYSKVHSVIFQVRGKADLEGVSSIISSRYATIFTEGNTSLLKGVPVSVLVQMYDTTDNHF